MEDSLLEKVRKYANQNLEKFLDPYTREMGVWMVLNAKISEFEKVEQSYADLKSLFDCPEVPMEIFKEIYTQVRKEVMFRRAPKAYSRMD
jgi:hypothetical protein